MCVRARTWLHKYGDTRKIPAWGKFWLACLGVYEWEGMNPIPPELWLFPYAFPLHPGRMWCHTRLVYLPMSYIYAKRLTPPCTPLTDALRAELYTIPYEDIKWKSCRNQVAETDLYSPHSKFLNFVNGALSFMEMLPGASWMRRKACDEALKHIRYEDDFTQFLCLGPVSCFLYLFPVFLN